MFPHPQDVYCVTERSQNPGNKTLMPRKGDDMSFTTSLQQQNKLPWLGSQQVWEEDSSSRPRSLFPKTVGATCLHKQLYLRNRNFNWLKPTVWNLEWKVGSPPPQHLYFGLWSFGRTAGHRQDAGRFHRHKDSSWGSFISTPRLHLHPVCP